ncbi:flavodoxin [Synergistales bacterium]|nr:flavodoxin [Synergistales bacterium]
MKNVLTVVFALSLAFSFIAFGNNTPATAATKDIGKILVAYFSLPETNNPNGMTEEEENSAVVINGEVLGNTQYAACVIREKTGADIFRIEPRTPYPLAHRTLVDQAKTEQNRRFRPTLKAKVKNLEQYDTIFLGYPNWWGDMPMLLYSFLEEHDLSGKTVIPFNTHGGSGFSGTIDTIAKLQPGATVQRNGLSISRGDVQDAAPEIVAWLKSLNF